MVILLGLIGNAGAGKDTMADILSEKYPNRVIKRAFAKPVKDVTKELFQFSDEQLYGSLKETVDIRWNITPREAFQIVGTNIMQFGIYGFMPKLLQNVPVRSFWVYHFKMWFQSLQTEKHDEHDDTIVIVPDVRFEHEAELIKELNGVLIKIDRPLDKTNEKYSHISETGINDIYYHYVIHNNGSIEKFKEDILDLSKLLVA